MSLVQAQIIAKNILPQFRCVLPMTQGNHLLHNVVVSLLMPTARWTVMKLNYARERLPGC